MESSFSSCSTVPLTDGGIADQQRIQRPLLSVIVPVFNESSTVAKVLDRIVEEPTSKEVIVVDDGSTDATGEIVRHWMESRGQRLLPDHVCGVALLQHLHNHGKGTAIRTGLAGAQGEFVIVQDADLELDPQEYSKLLQPALDNVADVIVGYRVTSRTMPRLLLTKLGIAALNLAVLLLYRVHLDDEACCFKLLRTADLRSMELDCRGFEFCPEVVSKAARLRLRFAQVPVAYRPRGVAEGKKLRLWDGLAAMSTLWRYRRWHSTGGALGCSPPSNLPKDAAILVGQLPAQRDELAGRG